jgi:Flp pilus assembly protein TadD
MANTDTLLDQGLAHHRAGRPGAAEPYYRAVLAARPEHADAQHLLGVALHHQGRHAAARPPLERACRARPDQPIFAASLARLCLESGDFPRAEAHLRHALRLRPEDCDLRHDLGRALIAQGRAPEAETLLRAAIADCSGNIALAGTLGTLLRAKGDVDGALPLLERAATAQDPDSLSNLGLALSDAGRLDDALARFDQALALAPGHADAAYNRATTLLLAGRLPEAWPGFERRWHRQGHQPPWTLTAPQWHGAATSGRLLLHADQGIGDTIQMARFLPALAARQKLAIAVHRTLLPLLRPLAPNATWHAIEDGLPDCDQHAPIMSLPGLLALDLPDLPGAIPYLTADPAAAERWQHRIADHPGQRIGLAWRGNPGYPADAARSLPAEHLTLLADVPGFSFVSLQPGTPAPVNLLDWTHELTDMGTTAALVAALDLVITVDTAVAHLAGALGRPVWLLNRFAPCWRWMLHRDDSPWYPTLHQFRQPAPGDWTSVIARVKAALTARRESKDRPAPRR